MLFAPRRNVRSRHHLKRLKTLRDFTRDRDAALGFELCRQILHQILDAVRGFVEYEGVTPERIFRKCGFALLGLRRHEPRKRKTVGF